MINEGAKSFNEWNIAKLEGVIEGLMAQRTITKDVCQRLKELLHDIETYTHRLEHELKEPVVTPV